MSQIEKRVKKRTRVGDPPTNCWTQFLEFHLINVLLYLLFDRFEDSAVFETPPLGRNTMPGKGRHASMKREMADPFEGLEKYGINTGHDMDENSVSKKRKRYILHD